MQQILTELVGTILGTSMRTGNRADGSNRQGAQTGGDPERSRVVGPGLSLQPGRLRPRLLAAPGGGPALPARNIIHLDGRDVGKSIVLSTDALHYAFTTRGGQGLIAAPHQGHLDTHHRGDRVPARHQPGPDEQRGADQVRQAQDPPQALLPAGVHQRLGALLPARPGPTATPSGRCTWTGSGWTRARGSPRGPGRRCANA